MLCVGCGLSDHWDWLSDPAGTQTRAFFFLDVQISFCPDKDTKIFEGNKTQILHKKIHPFSCHSYLYKNLGYEWSKLTDYLPTLSVSNCQERRFTSLTCTWVFTVKLHCKIWGALLNKVNQFPPKNEVKIRKCFQKTLVWVHNIKIVQLRYNGTWLNMEVDEWLLLRQCHYLNNTNNPMSLCSLQVHVMSRQVRPKLKKKKKDFEKVPEAAAPPAACVSHSTHSQTLKCSTSQQKKSTCLLLTPHLTPYGGISLFATIYFVLRFVAVALLRA